MHRWIPLFFLLASTVRVFGTIDAIRTTAPASAAAPAATASDRDAALERLQADARVTRLLDQAAADIKARRWDAALEKATAADQIRPNNSATLNTKGAALTELKRYDEAAVALAAAVTANPEAFPPRFNQAEVLALQKKYLDAVGEFTALQNRFGALPLLKYKVYACYVLADRPERAAEALRELRYPEDGVAWYFAHAIDRRRAGQRHEADRLIDAAKAIHGDETSTYRDSLEESGLLK